ncbi:DUF2914 domain-containing protein, partial [bacterium]|nr:DUF2914 domain-containing protein [bacterium]
PDGPPVCVWIPPLRQPSLTGQAARPFGGSVLVRVDLDARGQVVRSELLDRELPDLLAIEALRAARASRFRPAQRGGRPQPGSLILLLRFPGLPAAAGSAAPADSAARARPAAVPASAAPAAVAPRPAAPPPPTLPHTAGKLRVLDAGFGRGVENRRLVDRGQVFAPGDKVYFWMEVDGATPGQVLRHVWIYQGRELQEIALTIRGERWPTWSYKTLFPQQRGAWLLELRNAEDDLLGSWFCYCE